MSKSPSNSTKFIQAQSPDKIRSFFGRWYPSITITQIQFIGAISESKNLYRVYLSY